MMVKIQTMIQGKEIKYFTKSILVEANNKASMRLGRHFDHSRISRLPDNGLFPIIMRLVKQDSYDTRLCVVLDDYGQTGCIDVSYEFYDNLPALRL